MSETIEWLKQENQLPKEEKDLLLKLKDSDRLDEMIAQFGEKQFLEMLEKSISSSQDLSEKTRLEEIYSNIKKKLDKSPERFSSKDLIKNFIVTNIDPQISEDILSQIFAELGDIKIEKISSFISDGMDVWKIKTILQKVYDKVLYKTSSLKKEQQWEKKEQQWEKKEEEVKTWFIEEQQLVNNITKNLSELKSKYALEFKQNDYEGKKAQKIQELKSNPDLQKRLQASWLDLEKAADMIVWKEILTQLKSQWKIDKADESTLNQFLSSYSQLDKALWILPTNIVNISSNNSILDNKWVKDMMAQKNIQLDMNSDKWKDVLEKFSWKKFDKIPDEEKQNLMWQIDWFVNVDANQAWFKAQLNGLTRYFQQNMEKWTLWDLKFDADSVDAQMDSNKNWLSTSMSIIADGVNWNMKFDKDWNVFVTDLLDDKSGNFKSWERKLNTFFRIPDVKEFIKAAQSVDVLELAKSAKDPQDLRAKYNQLLQEKFEQINKKYHDNLWSAEVRYEIERFKNARKWIDVYSPKSELFDYPPKAISKDKNPQLFEYMGVVRDSYDYYGANDLQQISKLLQDIKKYVQEKNLKHPFNEYNPSVSGEQTFMELVREISVNVWWKNIFDKFKLDAYLKDLIWESEYVSGEEDFSQSILWKVSDVVSSV